ncbi:disulfide bond formation protein DsbB [Zobellella endophytica]|uniref:Disulfide bond formation protein B n=1 Tax=Zobellella endophytica TaxID=2116700 RepID=A0A2P7RDB3_9GAMM|nr:disulfide bond formation protein DsbB [Zobellella endophytica]
MYAFSRSRFAWALLTLGTTLLLLIALFFQYALGYQPCVMCVYQRAALVVVIAAGLLGWLAPRSPVLASSAMLIWLAASADGFLLAWEHVGYQLNPSPFNQCSSFAEFPAWLPLDSWLPALFFPTGDCADVDWSLLGWSMPQWLMGIFAVLAALAAFFMLVRLLGWKRARA